MGEGKKKTYGIPGILTTDDLPFLVCGDFLTVPLSQLVQRFLICSSFLAELGHLTVKVYRFINKPSRNFATTNT